MDDDSKITKDELISRANAALKKIVPEFVGNLKERVSKLETAIHKNEREEAMSIAYDLECEAATFGWPRVTRICKWIRKILNGDYDNKPSAEDVLKTLNALKLMVCDPENPNEDRDMALFKELYPILQKSISDI